MTRYHRGEAEESWQTPKGRQEQQPRETGRGGGSRTNIAVCALMQQQNGRSCAKVPVRPIKRSVCYYSPEPFTAIESF